MPIDPYPAKSLLNSRPFNLKIPPENDMNYSGGKDGMMKASSQSRLNIGIGAVYPRKFKSSIRWFLDYQDKNGKRIQRVVKHAQNESLKRVAVEFLTQNKR